jgi:hypothetical protein
MNKGVSRKLYFLSFIMTMAIVVYHSHGWIYRFVLHSSFPFANFPRNVSFQFYETIGSLSLGYFFAVTGFWLYYHTSTSNVLTKTLKRWKTLLIPLTTWNIIYLALDWGIDRGTLPFHNLTTFISGFTLTPFDGPLWYIFAVVLFTPFAPLILRLKNHGRLQLIIVFIALFAGFYFSNYYHGVMTSWSYWFWIERTLRYVSTYLVGAFLGLNSSFRTWLQQLTHSKWKYFALAVYLITVVLCGLNISAKLIWIMLRLQPIFVDTHFIPTRFQAKAANNSRHGQPARRNYLPLFICTLIQRLRIQKEEPLPYTV